MDRIEAYPFGNHHWMPQYTFLLPNTIKVRYDKLHATLDRIESHYIQDVKL